ncbi:hypothetical protein [Pectinatus sottacetonis]|uniref:hypothetical protein n=1 Tax=Pectinatus sottacetonis TaxID=1002795 RepID=UPI0018C477C7|nr:hypothetical protein [Pectinatus sottacetonis]
MIENDSESETSTHKEIMSRMIDSYSHFNGIKDDDRKMDYEKEYFNRLNQDVVSIKNDMNSIEKNINLL